MENRNWVWIGFKLAFGAFLFSVVASIIGALLWFYLLINLLAL